MVNWRAEEEWSAIFYEVFVQSFHQSAQVAQGFSGRVAPQCMNNRQTTLSVLIRKRVGLVVCASLWTGVGHLHHWDVIALLLGCEDNPSPAREKHDVSGVVGTILCRCVNKVVLNLGELPWFAIVVIGKSQHNVIFWKCDTFFQRQWLCVKLGNMVTSNKPQSSSCDPSCKSE